MRDIWKLNFKFPICACVMCFNETGNLSTNTTLGKAWCHNKKKNLIFSVL